MDQAGRLKRRGAAPTAGLAQGPELLPVGVRAYAVPERGGKRGPKHRRPPLASTTIWPQLVLLLDTETSADPIQRLLFGSYRLCRWDGGTDSQAPRLAVVEEGLFHGPDLPERDPHGYEILQDYARRESSAVNTADDSRVLELLTHRDFLDQVFWKATYFGRALVTGFNLPFDLSRLASHWTPTRGRQDGNRFAGGFSFILWTKAGASAIAPEGNPNRPRLLIRHVNRGLAFMQFSTRATEFGNARVPADDIEWAEPQYPGQRPGQFRGYFADLQTLTFALTDRHHSLDSACKAFDVPPELRKSWAKRHGIVSPEYISYNRQDVVASQALLERVRQELELHGAPLAPWDIHSPASLAKSALRQMGITPPLERAKAVSPVALGRAASAYFGGRAEARIRKTVVPVVYTDVTSMYPTVNTLAQLWDLLIAKELRTREVTRSARAALKAVTLDRCLSPGFWPRLRFFAEVEPKGEILPVRARYTPGSRSFTIGVNHLSADQTLWYSGFDLAASALLTGRVPHIRQAFTIEGEASWPP